MSDTASAVNVGIWGLGVFLPSEVRTNEWWPASIVDEWRARQSRRFTNLGDIAELSPGAKRVLEATARYADDPFEGGKERRVVDAKMSSSDLGTAAARLALRDAGVTGADVDILLVQSMVPDYHNTSDGCRIHLDLGLPSRCFTTTIDASCSGFLSQLVVAESLIRSGLGRCALLVQCAPMSRILRPEDPWSAAFGDAATAVVVGPVGAGRGVLAQAHSTDGSVHGGLVTGVPGARWHDEGAAFMYVEDHAKARGMVMAIPDAVKDLAETAMASARIRPEEVQFLASHQATDWFGEVMQAHIGLPNARRINTYPWTTSLSGCNLPTVMSIGQNERVLRDGDVVLMISGATGMTAGAVLLRWGR
jgi:3-oxoacyl-[acyl-carrier-protein] synthase-3